MSDEPGDSTTQAILVGTGAIAVVVVADLLGYVSLSGNLLQVLLAALLLPWAVVHWRRGQLPMAVALGLVALGNLAALGPPFVQALGMLGVLIGAGGVLAIVFRKRSRD